MDFDKRVLGHVLRLRRIAEEVQSECVDAPLLLRQQGFKGLAATRKELTEQAVFFVVAKGVGHSKASLPGRAIAFFYSHSCTKRPQGSASRVKELGAEVLTKPRRAIIIAVTREWFSGRAFV